MDKDCDGSSGEVRLEVHVTLCNTDVGQAIINAFEGHYKYFERPKWLHHIYLELKKMREGK